MRFKKAIMGLCIGTEGVNGANVFWCTTAFFGALFFLIWGVCSYENLEEVSDGFIYTMMIFPIIVTLMFAFGLPEMILSIVVVKKSKKQPNKKISGKIVIPIRIFCVIQLLLCLAWIVDFVVMIIFAMPIIVDENIMASKLSLIWYVADVGVILAEAICQILIFIFTFVPKEKAIGENNMYMYK